MAEQQRLRDEAQRAQEEKEAQERAKAEQEENERLQKQVSEHDRGKFELCSCQEKSAGGSKGKGSFAGLDHNLMIHLKQIHKN